MTDELVTQDAKPPTAAVSMAQAEVPAGRPVSAEPPPASRTVPAGQSRRGGVAATVVALIVLAIIGLSAWYLARPAPLIIQGEADSVRIDIAARVDGRIFKIPVLRGQDVPAGTVLLQIDNPELVAKYHEAIAAKGVAEAELAHIHAGTRAETIASR